MPSTGSNAHADPKPCTRTGHEITLGWNRNGGKSTRMKRRRRVWRIAMIVGGVLGACIAGLLIAIESTAPRSPSPLIDTKPIPETWLAGPPETGSSSSSVEETSPGRAPFSASGSLAILGNGKQIGEETYALDVSAQGASLESEGRFTFKVVLATIAVSFQQSLVADAALDPSEYRLQIDAPLGLGRKISSSIRGGVAITTQGDTQVEMDVRPDQLFVAGMFSTYALLPILYAEREIGGTARFDLLGFGGSPASGGDSQGPSALTVTRNGEATLAAGDLHLSVDRYRLATPYGVSYLFAKGMDFLGFSADADKETILVYRSDYFPNGFAITAAVPETD
jgi:hypothetical protein